MLTTTRTRTNVDACTRPGCFREEDHLPHDPGDEHARFVMDSSSYLPSGRRQLGCAAATSWRVLVTADGAEPWRVEVEVSAKGATEISYYVHPLRIPDLVRAVRLGLAIAAADSLAAALNAGMSTRQANCLLKRRRRELEEVDR